MAGAFQPNAFQNNAFQTSGVVSSISMPFPVNCVLMGQQLYGEESQFEATPGKVQKLSKDKPSFTVKTTSRGY